MSETLFSTREIFTARTAWGSRTLAKVGRNFHIEEIHCVFFLSFYLFNQPWKAFSLVMLEYWSP